MNIQNLADRTIAERRIVNCETLAVENGLGGTFNFADPQAPNAYRPQYGSSVAGRQGGNPLLEPEQSTSFTFSTVIEPRMFPNLALVLDYYEIEIDDVIAAVSAQVAGNNCVSGTSLNRSACNTLTRSRVDDPATPRDDRLLLIDFIQGSINYAKREVRGLDFTARYLLDTEEAFGRDFGRFNYRINGSWLIEQKNFNNIEDPADFTALEGTIFYPRVRFTSSLTWSPNDAFSVTWDADWQTSQDIIKIRNYVLNSDQRDPRYLTTGNYVRHDLSVRYNLRDDLTLRAGVVNVFDAEQAPWLGGAISSNFDPFGRRFSIGLNYRPY